MTSLLKPIDPPDLHRSPFFTQGMVAPAGPTLYVGGQDGVDRDGELVEGFEAQTEQALRNLLAVLDEADTGPENVVRLTIYLAPGLDAAAGFAASAKVWGDRRTAVTVIAAAPARPGALVEIDAIAVVPEG